MHCSQHCYHPGVSSLISCSPQWWQGNQQRAPLNSMHHGSCRWARCCAEPLLLQATGPLPLDAPLATPLLCSACTWLCQRCS
jgi:hypothetical protein